MARRIAVFGSTGSVGVQTLEVLSQHPEERVYALTAGKNVDSLRQQIRVHQPQRVVLLDVLGARSLQKEFPQLQVDCGPAALVELGGDANIDFVFSSVVGLSGLPPLLAALRSGKTVALANKEPLVAAGELLVREAALHDATIIPVDSEHSAIFQCLQGRSDSSAQDCAIRKLIITASGGPFRHRSLAELADVTPEEAGRHPRWKMGRKISIDSATMVNKGLEMVEARWLFGVEPGQIEVLIHPESIVHSMVEFIDGSVLAQLALPDMRLPIAYALSWPQRWPNAFPSIDWGRALSLHFEAPDLNRFPALELARQAMELGGTMPAVFNAANEAAVQFFCEGRTRFVDIVHLVEAVMLKHRVEKLDAISTVIDVSDWARAEVQALL